MENSSSSTADNNMDKPALPEKQPFMKRPLQKSTFFRTTKRVKKNEPLESLLVLVSRLGRHICTPKFFDFFKNTTFAAVSMKGCFFLSSDIAISGRWCQDWLIIDTVQQV